MLEIKVLSDEEFYEMRKQNERKSFLEELERMSKSSTSSGFSVKNAKKKEEPPIKRDVDPLQSGSLSSIMTDVKESGDWDSFVADLSEPLLDSPIESVTDENIVGFQLDIDSPDSDNRYSNYFKKELAMHSELLKGAKAQGARINSILKQLNTGKKGTGVTKGIADLYDVYNSNVTTQMQIIKAMSDLKTKQMEWNLKDKANKQEDGESTDSIADMYYKRIINGGTKNFIDGAMGGYTHSSNFQFDHINEEGFDEDESLISNEMIGDTSGVDSLALSTGFNITQPLNSGYQSYNDNVVGDEFGYIANENTQYEICVFQYGENNYEFAALDDEGNVVPGIELPSDTDPNILNNLTLRPGSDYVYDKYGRKYRTIQQDGVDISDIDQMDYPFGSDEYK